MRTVTIVGVGRVGGALLSALNSSGYEIRRLVSNDVRAAVAFSESFTQRPLVTNLDELTTVDTEFLFITTQDSNIRGTAERIASLGNAPAGACAFHCSGALSSGELSALCERGYRTASFHPLVSISDSTGGDSVFRDVFVSVEGDPEAVRMASQIVGKIGGKIFEISTEAKSLYHAAAVVACGHLVALFGTSIRMLSQCGVDEDTARMVMLPLVESTLANLREMSPSEALTGPFARGDVGIIAGHIRKIAEIEDENMESVYRILGLEAIELASKQGVGDAIISEMREIILLDKSNSK